MITARSRTALRSRTTALVLGAALAASCRGSDASARERASPPTADRASLSAPARAALAVCALMPEREVEAAAAQAGAKGARVERVMRVRSARGGVGELCSYTFDSTRIQVLIDAAAMATVKSARESFRAAYDMALWPRELPGLGDAAFTADEDDDGPMTDELYTTSVNVRKGTTLLRVSLRADDSESSPRWRATEELTRHFLQRLP